MLLLVVRHAIAEDRQLFARTRRKDALRPLTPYGRAQMRRATKGLRRVLPAIDIVGTSPLTRTVQTAEILSAAYGGPEVVRVAALDHRPDPAGFVRWLRSCRDAEVVGIVGHEMHLASLVSWLLSGKLGSFVPLKKGGACLLLFNGAVGAGKATLVWSLPPAQLRALGA